MGENQDSVEKTNSGLKKEGDIEDVSEFAEEVKDVIEEEDVTEDTVEKFRDWKPAKDDERKDIEKKTVETASIPEKPAEEKTEGLKKDMEKAGRAAKDAGKKAVRKENPGPELVKASRRFIRPVYSGAVKATRGFEKRVYSGMMVKFNPYFFDSREMSADLKTDKDGNYTMRVNVPDENYRKRLKDRFSEK